MGLLSKKILTLVIFSIAMGYLEAAVVIYLRNLYYPDGFQFPLATIEPSTGLIEFLREASTLIMLLTIGMLSGKNKTQRFAAFIFCFAIWDIFYYIFLKLLVGWPESFFTWDILFIIPIPWVGPVLAPCIVSLTMMLLGFLIIYYQEKGIDLQLSRKEWLLLIAGSLVVVTSFVQDYLHYCIVHKSDITLPGKDALFSEISTYIPTHFDWWLFLIGELLLLAEIFSLIKRIRK